MSRLRRLLEHPSANRRYAIADAAILDGLVEQLYEMDTDRFSCLLMGHIDPDVAHVAPYLIALEREARILDWLDHRLDQPWGYLVESPLDAVALQRHLRTFTETRGAQGEVMYFRFWDPRVMRYAASICTPEQLDAFMAPIAQVRLLDPKSKRITNFSWKPELKKLVSVDQELQPGQEQVPC